MTRQEILEPMTRAPRAPMLAYEAPQRRAGGPYGWLTPHIAELAAHNPMIAARILSLPRDELHFIALVLSFARYRDGVDHAALAGALGRDPRAKILAEFAPDCDSRIARLAGRLAGRPWRAPTYRRLAALYAEPHGRKLLAHRSVITRRLVRTLSRLPAAYRHPVVVRMIRRSRDLAHVLFAIEIVRRVRTDLTDRQIIASLANADSTYLRSWLETHYERLPFPKTPTGILEDGCGGVLRPVASAAELTRAGREFDNCARDYMWRALNGASFFYRYDIGGKRAAFIEVKPVPGLGWAIDQVAGPSNDPLSGELRARIIATFEEAGVHPAPQAFSSVRWFELE